MTPLQFRNNVESADETICDYVHGLIRNGHASEAAAVLRERADGHEGQAAELRRLADFCIAEFGHAEEAP